MKYKLLSLLLLFAQAVSAQSLSLDKVTSASDTETSLGEKVNVFLGSSGDHGQLSPAASYPFSMMSIGPQTYPATHTGYEHLAKKFLGFTHNRFEGVGCQGSGGNILVKPFIGGKPEQSELEKKDEAAGPGSYQVSFTNGIGAEFTVYKNRGMHRYSFPAGEKGLHINLAHAFVNGFVAEEHVLEGNTLSGWIDAKTTCSAGAYRLYYAIRFRQPVQWSKAGEHSFLAELKAGERTVEMEVAFSSVDVSYAKAALGEHSFDSLRERSSKEWDQLLGRIQVKGDPEREKLFYSLLYRAVQSPYLVSEEDGKYRAIDGSLQTSKADVYNGWAIWDNYKTQLPLLSFAFPERYQNIATSIANLYPYGKKDFATRKEPSNTVRTEHAIVVLLDAHRKGYPIDFSQILDSLNNEMNRLDYRSPDKALESSYDAWAFSQILAGLKKRELSVLFKNKALGYKQFWVKDFQDLTKPDVDRMSARGMYQGTVRQYRWSVPFDVKGLMALTGGEEAFVNQLDEFFNGDYYNRANEPDLQTPLLYNATSEPWKSQAWLHRLAIDTVVQHYFNDNSRGIGSYIGVIYKNQPAAYLRTMDDDAGAMSSWFVLTSLGIQPACVGWPVYYLNVPLFESAEINWPGGKPFTVQVENYAQGNCYIKRVKLNGKKLERNWITHEEIMKGGELVITASNQPDKTWGVKNRWVPGMEISK